MDNLVLSTERVASLDELIHQFLLQSGYPRASIVADTVALTGPVTGPQPDFIIVDPNTAATLAVIIVVDAVDADALGEFARLVGGVASRLGGQSVQAYVIRVDVQGASEAEQVQFYRVWPNSSLLQLSARTFPDLDSLRVSRKIAEQREKLPKTDLDASHQKPGSATIGMGAYLPGIVLALVALSDWLAQLWLGHTMIGISNAVLLVGAAVLLSVPAMLRFQRAS